MTVNSNLSRSTNRRNRRHGSCYNRQPRQATRSKFGCKVWSASEYWWEKSGLTYRDHFYHKRRGWCIDLDVLDARLADTQFAGVRIVCANGDIWEALAEEFVHYASEPFDDGFGVQVVLTEEHWHKLTGPLRPTGAA